MKKKKSIKNLTFQLVKSPKQYKRDGENVYLCAKRKMFVHATEEERVRQEFIAFLRDKVDVTGKSKTDTHTGDAKLAVNQFYSCLHDPEAHNAVTCSNPRSLIGAALLQSGLTDDLSLLKKPCLVIRGPDEPLSENKQRRSVMNEGASNPNGQVLIRKTTQPSPNFPGQKIWEMECKDCKHRYGANGCDVHHRRCPNCQGGKDGFDVTL